MPTPRGEMREILESEPFVDSVGDSGTQLVVEQQNPSASCTFGATARDRGWIVVQIVEFEKQRTPYRYIMFAPFNEVMSE